MKKSLLIIAAAGMIISSCSNESELPINGKNAVVDKDAVVINVNNVTTREDMSRDLVHAWNTSDVMGVFSTYDNAGTLTANGLSNATFTFHSTYTTAQQSFTNVFTQSDTPAVKWQSSDKKHNFWMYSPRDASATTTSNISFTLNSTQKQTTPNVWSNPTTTSGEYQGYNFIWYNVANAYRPYDRSIPFMANRLLPVAEFNIIRDDASLDGYYLTEIALVPSGSISWNGVSLTTTGGTMATGAVTAGATTNKIDLAALSNCSTLGFESAVSKYILDTKGTGNGIQIIDANLTKDHSFSVYMSVPSAVEKEYQVRATFTNGTTTKHVYLTRLDTFTVTNGKGNLVRYYLKSSAAYDPINELTDNKYYCWDEVLKTTDSGITGTGYKGYLEYMQDYNSTDATDQTTLKVSYSTRFTGAATNVCADCPTIDQLCMYLGAGTYYGDGPTGYSYTLPDGSTTTKGLWLMKKQYIAGFDAGTATKETEVYPEDGQPSDISKYFFLPAKYSYQSESFMNNEGDYTGLYWLSTPVNNNDSNNTGAFCLYFTYMPDDSGGYYIAGVENDHKYFGGCLWHVQ